MLESSILLIMLDIYILTYDDNLIGITTTINELFLYSRIWEDNAMRMKLKMSSLFAQHAYFPPDSRSSASGYSDHPRYLQLQVTWGERLM